MRSDNDATEKFSQIVLFAIISYHLHQAGYVFTCIRMLVGWIVRRITQERLNDFHEICRPGTDPNNFCHRCG